MMTSKVLDLLIAKMENGVIPWERPWVHIPPQNLATGHQYRGINLLVLALSDYESPYWVSFNQAKALGGNIRKGEHGTPILVPLVVKDKETDLRHIAGFRTATVFNIEQTENIQAPTFPDKGNVPEAQALWEKWGDKPAMIQAAAAWYDPANDCIGIPAPAHFTDPDLYWASLWHEAAHSTAHVTRLNRPIAGMAQGDIRSYAEEELIAEIASAMLCAHCGIEKHYDNAAAYLQSWLKPLKDNPNILLTAASKAGAVVDYIIQSGA